METKLYVKSRKGLEQLNRITSLLFRKNYSVKGIEMVEEKNLLNVTITIINSSEKLVSSLEKLLLKLVNVFEVERGKNG